MAASDTFSITDPQTSKRCIEALNDSFDSIKMMVGNYTPKTTKQDYAVLFYNGPIKEGSKIYVTEPAESAIPIYAQYLGTFIYVGDLVERTLAFSTTLEDDDYLIYQPYRTAIVKETIGLNSGDRFYSNDSEKIHQ